MKLKDLTPLTQEYVFTADITECSHPIHRTQLMNLPNWPLGLGEDAYIFVLTLH